MAGAASKSRRRSRGAAAATATSSKRESKAKGDANPAPEVEDWLYDMDWSDPEQNPYYHTYYHCPVPAIVRKFRLPITVVLAIFAGACMIVLAPFWWSVQVLLVQLLMGILFVLAALFLGVASPVPSDPKHNIPENHLSFVAARFLVEIGWAAVLVPVAITVGDFAVQRLLRAVLGVERNLLIWDTSGWPLLFSVPSGTSFLGFIVVGPIWVLWTILSHAAVVLTVFFFTLWTAQRLLVPRKILKSAPIGLTQLDTVFTHEMLVFALDPVNTSANSEELTAAKELLGLPTDAGTVDAEALRKAFRKVSLKNHPDKLNARYGHSNATAEERQELQKATERYQQMIVARDLLANQAQGAELAPWVQRVFVKCLKAVAGLSLLDRLVWIQDCSAFFWANPGCEGGGIIWSSGWSFFWIMWTLVVHSSTIAAFSCVGYALTPSPLVSASSRRRRRRRATGEDSSGDEESMAWEQVPPANTFEIVAAPWATKCVLALSVLDVVASLMPFRTVRAIWTPYGWPSLWLSVWFIGQAANHALLVALMFVLVAPKDLFRAKVEVAPGVPPENHEGLTMSQRDFEKLSLPYVWSMAVSDYVPDSFIQGGASSKWSTQRQNSGVVLRKNVQALRNAIMVAAAVSAIDLVFGFEYLWSSAVPYASTFRSIWSVCSMVGGAGFAMIWRFAVGALFVPGMALNCLLLLLKVVPVSKVPLEVAPTFGLYDIAANHDMRIYLYFFFIGVPLVGLAATAQILYGMFADSSSPHASPLVSDPTTGVEEPVLSAAPTGTGDDPTKQALAEVKAALRDFMGPNTAVGAISDLASPAGAPYSYSMYGWALSPLHHLSIEAMLLFAIVGFVAFSSPWLNPQLPGPTRSWGSVLFVFGIVPFVLWYTSPNELALGFFDAILWYSLPALAFTFVTSIAWFRRDFIVGRAVWQTAGSVAKGGGAEEKAPRQGDDAETQEPIPETFNFRARALEAMK